MLSRGVLSRRIFSGRPTLALLRFLDWIAEHTLPPEKIAAHHRTGKRGEEAAYFHLRTLGYTMVARNFRSPRCRGEIDLIGWEDDRHKYTWLTKRCKMLGCAGMTSGDSSEVGRGLSPASLPF